MVDASGTTIRTLGQQDGKRSRGPELG